MIPFSLRALVAPMTAALLIAVVHATPTGQTAPPAYKAAADEKPVEETKK